MDEMMTFPDTWEEFEKLYGFNDAEEIYTNNSRLIPSFRVKQWLDHLPSVKPTHKTPSNTLGALDCVDRQKAIEAIEEMQKPIMRSNFSHEQFIFRGMSEARQAIIDLPSVQLDRDMPMKPIETTDRAWGIPNKQAVCPKCDYYLGNVSFLGDYKGKRITYCETCGQAIDWEGWDFDD